MEAQRKVLWRVVVVLATVGDDADEVGERGVVVRGAAACGAVARVAVARVAAAVVVGIVAGLRNATVQSRAV